MAHDFLDAVERGSALDAMLSSVPLEGNRSETLKFAEELAEILMGKIKKSQNLPETAREYMRMYELVREFSPLLDTNINLSLFFSALTSKIVEAKGNN